MNRKTFYFIFSFFILGIGIYADGFVPITSSGFVIISQDNVSVYAKPDLGSSEILSLSIGSEVKILKTKSFKSKDKKELWCYIDTKWTLEPQKWVRVNGQMRLETYKGWVKSEYLAGKNNFHPVKETQEMFIVVNIPDILYEYHIYKDGSVKTRESFSNLMRTGLLYKYKNLYYVVFNENGNLFFYSLIIIHDLKNVIVPFSSGVNVILEKNKFPF